MTRQNTLNAFGSPQTKYNQYMFQSPNSFICLCPPADRMPEKSGVAGGRGNETFRKTADLPGGLRIV